MDQIEEIEQEGIEQDSPSKTLLRGFLIFAGIIVLGLIFMPKPKKNYKLTEEQMLGQLVSHEGVMGPEKIVDLIYQPSDKYQFIDLRSATEYLKGHLPEAINIPVERIFDKEYQEILNHNDKINVLYASDHAAACGPWMILTQLGYKNNEIMLGGYSYVNQFIINQFAPMSGNFKDEKPKFDFANIIRQTSGGAAVSNNSQNEKSSGTPVVKKKKEGKSSEGC